MCLKLSSYSGNAQVIHFEFKSFYALIVKDLSSNLQTFELRDYESEESAFNIKLEIFCFCDYDELIL